MGFSFPLCRKAHAADLFLQSILDQDQEAAIITAGDFNEFSFVEPLKTYAQVAGLRDLDEVAGIEPLERYTYSFDMNAQQLDHMYVSEGASKKAEYEHVHVNTWVTAAEMISDHDPSVAKLNVCR